jgi:hypothetical protein
VAGLAGVVLVAQVVRALAWVGGADLDVQARQFTVAQLDAGLAVGAVQVIGDDVLREFYDGHSNFRKWVG